jgi:hypothetical protein
MKKVLKQESLVHHPELSITYPKRLCVRCGEAEAYLDIATMDHCEGCLWALLSTDPDFSLAIGALTHNTNNV